MSVQIQKLERLLAAAFDATAVPPWRRGEDDTIADGGDGRHLVAPASGVVGGHGLHLGNRGVPMDAEHAAHLASKSVAHQAINDEVD